MGVVLLKFIKLNHFLHGVNIVLHFIFQILLEIKNEIRHNVDEDLESFFLRILSIFCLYIFNRLTWKTVILYLPRTSLQIFTEPQYIYCNSL